MIDTICGESDAFHPGRLYLSLFFRIVRTVKHRFFADNQLTVFHKFLSPFTEVADHFCTHACQQLFIFLVAHSIMQFFRIFGKVKQLLFTCIEVPDIFNLSVGQSTPIVVITVASGMFQIDVFAPFRFCAFSQR